MLPSNLTGLIAKRQPYVHLNVSLSNHPSRAPACANRVRITRSPASLYPAVISPDAGNRYTRVLTIASDSSAHSAGVPCCHCLCSLSVSAAWIRAAISAGVPCSNSTSAVSHSKCRFSFLPLNRTSMLLPPRSSAIRHEVADGCRRLGERQTATQSVFHYAVRPVT